jgi:hypothetical protein
MQRPIFLLVSDNASRLETLCRDLSRRYEADYQVLTVVSAATALTVLAGHPGSGAEVALIIADEHLADMPAADFLARAHGLQPGAKRILLIDRGTWATEHPGLATMVVRGADLGATMSSYLVTEISKTGNIRVRLGTEVTGGQGQCGLETLTLRDRASGAIDTVGASALFVMIGAEPRTSWLPPGIERDAEGFTRTGRDLYRAGELPVGWPLERPPLLRETSIPGVFAAGDVRHRSIKRLASTVGEGATAIQLGHEFLRAEQD